MDPSPRREFTSTTTPDGKSEISSDGRTIWVNKGICVARFCPLSHEYAAVEARGSSNGLGYRELLVPHNNTDLPMATQWVDFVVGVKNRWGIEIGPEHNPLYV
jgi:hypothetical protein